MKTETPAEPVEQIENIHDLGLKGIETIDAQGYELLEELVHVTARMNHDVPALLPHRPVHPGERGAQEFMPQCGTHDEAALLAPVVPEINSVDVVPQCLGTISML